jgi:hypothetical protein
MPKKRYADLSQLIDLANMYRPWPEQDTDLATLAEMPSTQMNLLLDGVRAPEADGHDFVLDHMELLWAEAKTRFGRHPDYDVALSGPDGTVVLPFNSPRALHETAQTLRTIFNAIANAPLRDDRFISVADLFHDLLLPALTNLDDFSRLRACPECQQIYLAKPKHRETCSKVCAAVRRAKKFRREHPGYYTAAARKKRRQRRRKLAPVGRKKIDQKSSLPG